MLSSEMGVRPAGVTCERYAAGEDGRRCRHYLDNGGCRLPSEFMCVEWLKRNPPRDDRRGTAPLLPPRPVSHPLGVLPQSHPLSATDIERLQDLRTEVCIRDKTHGEFWVVPAFTGADRAEITLPHLATIGRVLRVFPDAEVVAVNRPGSTGTKPVSTAPRARNQR